MAMPMTTEEISVEWLSSILGHKVHSFTVTSTILNQTTGKIFLDLKYEDGAAADEKCRPAHLCLKGSFNPAMTTMPGYEAEFFARVAPKLPTEVLHLPNVWWAGASPVQKQAICTMEDLNRRPGIRHGAGPSAPAACTTAALEKHFATRNPRFLCFLHGDAHVGNLFVNDGGPPSSTSNSRPSAVRFTTWRATSPAARGRRARALPRDARAARRAGALLAPRRGGAAGVPEVPHLGDGLVLTPEQIQKRERVEAMTERYAAAFEDHKVIQLIESLP
ncbi:kinase-like domain-containing protein [Apiospora hydei]|uniref:Kinase-like domain-containing protein n=1 Tax=Apiospora hydei TaxID=1337664 RepID=A0ABR1V1J4_9PEZI